MYILPFQHDWDSDPLPVFNTLIKAAGFLQQLCSDTNPLGHLTSFVSRWFRSPAGEKIHLFLQLRSSRGRASRGRWAELTGQQGSPWTQGVPVRSVSIRYEDIDPGVPCWASGATGWQQVMGGAWLMKWEGGRWRNRPQLRSVKRTFFYWDIQVRARTRVCVWLKRSNNVPPADCNWPASASVSRLIGNNFSRSTRTFAAQLSWRNQEEHL